MKKILRFIGWISATLVVFFVVQVIRTGRSMPVEPEISYSRFIQQVADGQVSKVTIIGNLVVGYGPKSGSFHVIVPENQLVVMEALQRHGVEIWFKDASSRSWPFLLLNCSPVLILAILSAYLAWQARPRRMGT